MKFKANGLIWEVQSVQRDNEKLKVKGAECLGVTYYKDLQIFLDCTLPKELFRQTVIHELIHFQLWGSPCSQRKDGRTRV